MREREREIEREREKERERESFIRKNIPMIFPFELKSVHIGLHKVTAKKINQSQNTFGHAGLLDWCTQALTSKITSGHAF